MLTFFLTILKVVLYYPFINILTFLIWLVPGHYAALGIILLTLLVRFVLMVPSKRGVEAQRKMTQLQPLLEELKKEYGNDRAALAQAQSELYKKNNINPLGSCLPMLIQLPVLYILYYTFLHGLVAHSPHLYSWVPRPETINTDFFGLNLLDHDPTYLIALIAAALQFWQSRMMLAAQPKQAEGEIPDQAQAMQRLMVYFIPLITLYVAGRVPAGVVLYWVVSTAFTIFQQQQVIRERLTLTGVDQVVAVAEHEHPENTKKLEALRKDLLDGKPAADSSMHTSNQKGVTVTVRKKSKG